MQPDQRFTEPSSALLGLVGDVPGVAVGGVVPLWFHWEFCCVPVALEPDVSPDVLLPELDEEPVAELSLAPLLEFVSVVLHAAGPKHMAAARRALVMVMMVPLQRVNQ